MIATLHCAFSKDGAPDADVGGALFDRDFEVVGHAHRKGKALQVVAGCEGAERAEPWPRCFRVVRCRGHRHQAVEAHGGDRACVRDQRRQLARRHAMLRCFGGDVDLEHDWLGRGRRVRGNGVDQAFGVDSVEYSKASADVPDLVALKVADEVKHRPWRGSQAVEFRHLGEGLLHIILAKHGQPGAAGATAWAGCVLLTAMRVTARGVAAGAFAGACVRSRTARTFAAISPVDASVVTGSGSRHFSTGGWRSSQKPRAAIARTTAMTPARPAQGVSVNR